MDTITATNRQSLRGYLEGLRLRDGLLRIPRAVDPARDLAAVAWRARDERGCASLFESIDGYRGWQVAAQVIRNRADWAQAFGLTRERVLFELRDRLKRPIEPVWVADAPINEIEPSADLAALPLPVRSDADRGVASGVAVLVVQGAILCRADVARTSPVTMKIAVESVHVERVLAAGGRTPAVLVFGAHPAMYLAAELSESGYRAGYALAGGLLGEPLRVVTGAHTGLPIAAEAEVAIEGEIEGDTFCARRMVRRRAPILWSMHADAAELRAMAAELAIAEHLRNVEGGLELIDLRCPAAAENRIVVVKMRGRVEGQSKTALIAALSSPAVRPKLAIGVDEDINLDDLRDVGWSMASRTHAEVDVGMIDGVRVHGEGVGAKWYFDSTMPALTQPAKRETFERAIPKNLERVRLEDFLP